MGPLNAQEKLTVVLGLNSAHFDEVMDLKRTRFRAVNCSHLCIRWRMKSLFVSTSEIFSCLHGLVDLSSSFLCGD